MIYYQKAIERGKVVPTMPRRFLEHLGRVDSIENHTFLPHTLSPGSIVVDLGANTGFFAREIAARYGVRSYGIEANPSLCASLENTSLTTYHNIAIAGIDGPIELNLSEDHTSSSVVARDVPNRKGSVVVPGMTFQSFLLAGKIDAVDLLKVDIEGAEVVLFESLPDAAILALPQITIEFHDDHGFITRRQFTDIHRRLTVLGFTGIQFASNNTNWLFYQSQRVKVGTLQTGYIRHLVRNVRGATRRLGFRSK